MYQIFEVYASILSSHNKLAIPTLDMSLSQTYFKNGNSVALQPEKIILCKHICTYYYSLKHKTDPPAFANRGIRFTLMCLNRGNLISSDF